MTAKELLQGALKNSIQPEEFLRHLWALSNGVVRSGKKFLGTDVAPIRLYRARRFSSGSNLPLKACELSYPPSPTKEGRAGAAGASILYVSAGIETTFPESRCEAGDILIVGEFRCYQAMFMNLLVDPVARPPHSEYEHLVRTLFTHPGEELYKYTSKISEHLLKGDFINGLLYPSIITGSDSDNLALKAEFCDRSLSLAHATAYRVKEVGPTFKYEVDQFDFAKPRNGLLEWRGRVKKWELPEPAGEYKVVRDGAAHDVFDKFGKLVDPN